MNTQQSTQSEKKGKARRGPITAEEKLFAVQEYNKGVSSVEIGKVLGFNSCQPVINTLKEQGIDRRKSSGWDHKKGVQIAAIFKEGKTVEDISKQFNLPLHRIYLFLEKAGISTGKVKVKPTSFTPNYTTLNLKGHDYAGIYKFTNRINGKVYIGSGQNIYIRYCGHARMTSTGRGFPVALKKYGIGNFDFEVIERVENLNTLLDRETYWIGFYQACDSSIGYNLLPIAGSSRGARQRPEVIEARRQRRIGKGILSNRKRIAQIDPTTNQIIDVWDWNYTIELKTGLSAATIANMCRQIAGKKRKYVIENVGGFKWQYTNLPATITADSDNALPDKKKGRRTRQVSQLDIKTGEVLKVWNSAADIQKELGFHSGSISVVCRGWYAAKGKKTLIRKNQLGGFKWAYTDGLKSHELPTETIKVPSKAKGPKEVRQIDLQTGSLIKVWIDARKAAKDLGLSMSSIQCVCRGARYCTRTGKYVERTAYGGYKWEYVESKDTEPTSLKSSGKTIAPKESKKVAQINIDTGEIIKVWDSAYEAAKQIGCSRDSIAWACDGFRRDAKSGKMHPKKSQSGYRWEYLDSKPVVVDAPINGLLKSVQQIDIITNEILKTWPSSREAQKGTGISGSSICAACRGYYYCNKTKKHLFKDSHGGFKWKYTQPTLLDIKHEIYQPVGNVKGGYKHTPEARAKMSAVQTGRKHTPETKAKLSNKAAGRKHTPEQRERYLLAMQNRVVKPLDPETRARVAEARRNANFKKVAQIDLLTGQTVRVWESLLQIKAELGSQAGSIGNACRGFSKHYKSGKTYSKDSHGGYRWQYVDPNPTTGV